MKLRITGTRAECAAVVTVLAGPVGLAVREVSEFYPNRGASELGRIYLEIAPPDTHAPAQPDPGAGSVSPARSTRRRIRRSAGA